MMQKRLEFPPGTRWSYSNSGYVLLGAIIEKVTQGSYESFLARRFFEPLGMTRTGFDRGEVDNAVNYANKTAKADVSALPFTFAAEALCSTVDELVPAGTRRSRRGA